jgi:thiamine kinase-like enzyme
MTKINKIKNYMENYKELFAKVFPKKGIASLCHNDVHRLNLLLTEDTEKVFILDHEYACLNLAGVDIVNYMIETKFDYTKKAFPFYEFEGETLQIDFARFYEVFLNFMEKFEAAHSIDEDHEYFMQFQKCKKFKYFYKIVCVISLSIFLLIFPTSLEFL